MLTYPSNDRTYIAVRSAPQMAIAGFATLDGSLDIGMSLGYKLPYHDLVAGIGTVRRIC